MAPQQRQATLQNLPGASSVFANADGDDKQWCAIGSIKSQIGHTKGAAGAASLIKSGAGLTPQGFAAHD